MSILPLNWYLIVECQKDFVPAAMSEGTDAYDAIRNYREQAGIPETSPPVLAVLWNDFKPVDGIPSYPSMRA
jgi:hypothetical protein